MTQMPLGKLILLSTQGVEHITGKQTSAGVAFVMTAFLGIVGILWLQSKFNALSAPTAAPAPAA